MLALLVLATGGVLEAQGIPPGSRVRVQPVTGAPWEYGRFQSVTTDSVELGMIDGSGRRRFSLVTLGRMEVYDGQDGARLRHAKLGLFTGAVAGAVAIGIAMHRCESAAANAGSPPACGMNHRGRPLLLLGGAGAGALVGAAWPVRHWRRMRIAPAAPARGPT